MQVDVKQTVAAALTIGMFIMFINLIGHGPLSPSSPEVRQSKYNYLSSSAISIML
jgi:hypothetical protein